MKIKDFRAPGTGAPARRTFKNAHLSMVFKGAGAPAVAAAAKKGAPSGTRGSLCVLEHVRPCRNPIPAVRVDVGNLIKP